MIKPSPSWACAPRMPSRRAQALAAERLLTAIEAAFALPGGGYRELGEHPFQANGQMHLFEACLLFGDGAGDRFRETADRLAHLALDRLIDPALGVVDEFYDAAWRPVSSRGTATGRRIEPGHQFEWAWLLLEWRATGGGRPVAGVARRLFAAGEAGVRDSLATGAVDETGRVVDPLCRLWPQTERLRTAARLAAAAPGPERDRYRAAARDAARGLRRYLETPIAGLWRDKWTPGEGFRDEPAPASSLYHLTGAIVALKRQVLDSAARGEAAAAGEHP